MATSEVNRRGFYPVVALMLLAVPTLAEVPPAASMEEQVRAVYLGCGACHGELGEGRKPRHAPRIAGQDPAYLQLQMEAFRSGRRGEHQDDTYGKHMTLMAATVADETVLAALSKYVASLPNVAAPGSIQGDLTRGAQLYQTCASCHGAAGEGVPALGGPRLAGFDDWYLKLQLQHYRDGVRGYHEDDIPGRQMAAQAKALKDDRDLNDLVAHIADLATR